MTYERKETGQINLVLGSHSEDIPEHEDMVYVNYSNRTKKTCPLCHVLDEYLNIYSVASLRTLEETIMLLTGYESRLSMAEPIRVSRPAAARVVNEEEERILDD